MPEPDLLGELEQQVRTLMQLAEETDQHVRRLQERCVHYRTIIFEQHRELEMLRAPSEAQQLQQLLDTHGI